MRLSAILAGVAAAAELVAPIAAYRLPPKETASAKSTVRAVSDAAVDVSSNILKRKLGDDLFSYDNGVGRRYWAWSKLAYDEEYNRGGTEKTLANNQEAQWRALIGSDITVWGYAPHSLPSDKLKHWETHTGMYVVVGVDKSLDAVVIAFIGSNDAPTWKQDFKPPLVRGPGDGKVHDGFMECYESTDSEAFLQLKRLADEHSDYDIVVVGHSLGGATAHVAALGFAKTYGQLRSRMHVFTYGAPRAGDRTFQVELRDMIKGSMANFQDEDDGVPHLPPVWMEYANAADRHVIRNSPDGRAFYKAENWEKIEETDEDRQGFRYGVSQIFDNIWNRGRPHTGYFPEVAGGARKRTFLSTAYEKRQDDPRPGLGGPTEGEGVNMSPAQFEWNQRQAEEFQSTDPEDHAVISWLEQELNIDDVDKVVEILKQTERGEQRARALRLLTILSSEAGAPPK